MLSFFTLVLASVAHLAPVAPAAPAADWEVDLGALGSTRPTSLWACGDTLIVQDSDHAVTALDPTTGQLRWFARLHGELSSAPTASGGNIVLSAGREIVVVEAVTGRSLLRGKLATAPGATPVADEQLVYVPSLADDTFVALDPVSGLAAWRFRIRDGFVGSATMLGSGDQRLVVVPTFDGHLRALPAGPNLPTQQRWVLPTGTLLGDTVTRDDQLLIGAVGGVVARVDGASGRFHWRRLMGEALAGQPVTGADLALAATTTRLVALDWENGSVRWERDAAGTPVGVAGQAIVVRHGNALEVLRARDGASLGRRPGLIEGAAVVGEQLVTLSQGRVAAWSADALTR